MVEPDEARKERDRLRRRTWERKHKGRFAKWREANRERHNATRRRYWKENAERLRPINAKGLRDRYHRKKAEKTTHP